MPLASRFSTFPTRYGIVMHITYVRHGIEVALRPTTHVTLLSRERLGVYLSEIEHGRGQLLTSGDDLAALPECAAGPS